MDTIYELLNFIVLLKDYTDKGFLHHTIVKNTQVEIPKPQVAKPQEKPKVIVDIFDIKNEDGFLCVKVSHDVIKQRQQEFDKLYEKVKACQKCSLHTGRKNTVFGDGVLSPTVVAIGEAPGMEEDERGLPFVGKSGQYAEKWFSAINLSREKNLYVMNVIKCRPPKNRDPHKEEIHQCHDFIDQQLKILKPLAILSLGGVATSYLKGDSDLKITKERGKKFLYNDKQAKSDVPQILVMPTYHPSAVLRANDIGDFTKKKAVWDDLKELQKIINEYTPT